MKLQSLYIIAGAIMFTAFTSCKKDLLKDNTNPDVVNDTSLYDANNLLTTAQLFYTGSTDNGIEVEETEIMGAGCFIQHFASTSGYYFGDKYLNSPGGWSSYYDHAYTYQVKNIVELLNLTAGKAKYKNLHQMARIVKALIFERITDIYGDVPYFDAGKGYSDRIFFPKYDKQQDIYTDLLKEVSQATDSLDVNADRPIGDIYYYNPDDPDPQIDKWKRFGNTLLLRMAMRLTKVDPTTAQSYVTKVQGHTMESNDDNAIVVHGTDNLTMNKVWRGIGLDGDVQLSCQLSEKFVNTLKGSDADVIDSTKLDPRLSVFAVIDSTGSSNAADQFGLPNGYDLGNTIHGLINYPKYKGSINQYSRPSPTVFNISAPTLVLTYAESELLLADAKKRWGIGTGTVIQHYNNGVTAAMTQLAAYGDGGVIDPEAITAYLTTNPYKDADGLNQINTQFWIATFYNDFEAWSNYRRTGYPVLTPVVYPGSRSSGAIPRRMAYSTTDKQINTANYNAAVANLPGGDQITSRMWWDKQ